MDREYVATLLLLATAAPALWIWNTRPNPSDWRQSARGWEAHGWRALWLSASPLLVTVPCVVGWWIAVPDACPLPPKTILAGGALFALVCGRAAWRAAWSLWAARSVETVGTVGLWRPRVLIPERCRALLDAAALRAALAHEAAHAHHRDPLRLWLAQVITDLQWPWPWARARFASWHASLEMARDEEARQTGVDGSDLAVAIVALARDRQRAGAAVLLTPETERELRLRVARLLVPLAHPVDTALPRLQLIAVFLLAVLTVASGLLFGRPVVWAAFRVLP